MFGLETVVALIAKHGLIILAPIAVLEGPIATVIAAWLASQNLLSIWGVMIIVVLANLVGDLGHYAIGRWGLDRLPQRWRDRLGLNRARLLGLRKHFRSFGVRTLLVGKFTQVAIGPILVAAGLGRMNIWKFTWVAFLATIPTSLVFVALGYTFGSAYSRIDGWIGRLALIGGGLLVFGGLIYFMWKRSKNGTMR